MKNNKSVFFFHNLNQDSSIPSSELSEVSCQRSVGPKSLRRFIRALPWLTAKSDWPGLKKDIKIIIVVTNNLSVAQAAKLWLPAMPYFHSILKLTVKASQEKRNSTKVNLKPKNSTGERSRFKPKRCCTAGRRPAGLNSSSFFLAF